MNENQNHRGRALLAGLLIAAMFIGAGAVLAQRTMTTSNIYYVPDYGDGAMVGKTTAKLVGFHGTAPTAQRSDASQVAITDNTGGAVSDTLAAGVGVHELTWNLPLVGITGNVDVVTAYTPTYAFKILGTCFAVTKVVTTAAKAATLNLEIESTNLTGGVVALTSTNCTPLGAIVPGTAVTAANTGTAGQTISLEAASVTAFSEGDGTFIIRIQNMDEANFAASLADKWNELRTTLLNKGLITGS